MSKNQINYLLALGTFIVIWLYFNTFFAGAMMQKKMALTAGASAQMALPAMDPRNFNPYGNRLPYMNQNQQPGFAYSNRPASFTPPSVTEIQKMAAAQRGKEVPLSERKP